MPAVLLYRSFLSAWLQSGLDLLAPRRCLACASSCAPAFCARCAPRLFYSEPQPRHFDGIPVPVYAAGPHRAELRDAIHHLKYRERPDIADRLGACWVPRLPAALLDAGTYLVPTPLHASRLAERGYNQSALLARSLSTRSPARWLPSGLRRTRPTAPQVGLSAHERHANLLGCFQAAPQVRARRVMVVDDVITTGTTLRLCLQALAEAGAQPVAALCVSDAKPVVTHRLSRACTVADR